MKYFPMFLAMEGRRVVIVGAGEEAAQKLRLLGRTEAGITVHAEGEAAAELVAAARAGRIVLRSGLPRSEDLAGAALVVIATGEAKTDAEMARRARAAGALVNVVDRPELCDAITPSIVDRDPVVVAIGTEGAAPVLARRIRERLEAWLAPDIGGLVALAGRLRDDVARTLPPELRRRFWAWVFDGPPARAWEAGDHETAERLMREAIAGGVGPEDRQGAVAFVVVPGARDLLTMRAVRRLQEADVIYHDGAASAEVAELARRDAERVETAPNDDAASVAARLAGAAAAGRRVVRLAADRARARDESAALARKGLAAEWPEPPAA